MDKTKRLLCYMGNAQDIKASLAFIDPVDPAEIDGDLSYVQESLEEELRTFNRKTVIRMLQAKIKKLEQGNLK